MSGNAREISLGEGFGDVVLRVNGAMVEVHADGSVDTYTDAAVDTHSSATHEDRVSIALIVRVTPAESHPGDRMSDGTIYAGVSPDKGEPMYTTPADAPLTTRWRDGMNYAAGLDAHGHQDWRVPTKAELNVLYENRDKGALRGTFNVTGSYPAGWYWSSTEDDGLNYAWSQRFSDRNQGWYYEYDVSSLRCVR